ncbi:hypothetical protein BS47DRAFT_1339596 [Hydnum rufescens UP504]|uniref:Uncharacterized protein n=1 Tax=Hydnum rufescens UP504 TaxID=1448309 RepID=A0A9P6B4I9_9AGAM|nr:hypothetical protein BS47DRAFT_1339596 [Hydnum rufescens UP504]
MMETPNTAVGSALQYATDSMAVYLGPPPPLIHFNTPKDTPDNEAAEVLLMLGAGR